MITVSESVEIRHYALLMFSKVFGFWPHYSVPVYGFVVVCLLLLVLVLVLNVNTFMEDLV